MAHYHLIGICGTAMASLAGMLKKRGHRVTGSDENVYPPMSVQLEALGVPVSIGYRAENFTERPDVIVVGNAIPRGNAELEYALDRRWIYTSMPDVLKREFLQGRRVLAIAGTHGKTTTTAMASWVLEVGGLNPSFLIGGVAENFGASFRVAESEYFVIEADEYDTAYFDKGPKFMHYAPEIGVVNNVEFDHADIYADLEAVKTAFRRFINLIPRSGALVAGFDSPSVRELASRSFAPVENFALGCVGAAWSAQNVVCEPDGTKFVVFRGEEKFGDFKMPLFGDFNVRNSLAVIAAAVTWGVTSEKIAEGLATFKSVKRRMQVRGEVGGVIVIDDFAHHPTAVKETLDALAERFVGRRVFAVFEPRSWSSRKKAFQRDYEAAFAAAAGVVIAPVFESFKLATDDQFSPEQLAESLTHRGVRASVVGGADAIIAHLLPELCAGDVVAIMSNGGFEGIHEKFLKALDLKEGGR